MHRREGRAHHVLDGKYSSTFFIHCTRHFWAPVRTDHVWYNSPPEDTGHESPRKACCPERREGFEFRHTERRTRHEETYLSPPSAVVHGPWTSTITSVHGTLIRIESSLVVDRIGPVTGRLTF